VDRFDENTGMYVFGYGSLVSPASVALTLGRPVGRPEVVRAHLAGWRRSWNVGTDRESHPERTFLVGGQPFTGLAVVLGIEPDADAPGCPGAVFPVRRADLDLLDLRERNYRRIAVTGAVTWAGKPDRCVVLTYVPRDEATERITRARGTGRAMAVRREYLELVENAFDSVDQLALFHATTPPPAPDMPVTAMEAVIDPGLASAIRRHLPGRGDGPA
jgi:cation transport regulator ChaC